MAHALRVCTLVQWNESKHDIEVTFWWWKFSKRAVVNCLKINHHTIYITYSSILGACFTYYAGIKKNRNSFQFSIVVTYRLILEKMVGASNWFLSELGQVLIHNHVPLSITRRHHSHQATFHLSHLGRLEQYIIQCLSLRTHYTIWVEFEPTNLELQVHWRNTWSTNIHTSKHLFKFKLLTISSMVNALLLT